MGRRESVFIPANPGMLTPEWVTDALTGAGALSDARVSSIVVEPIGGGGVGLTGDTVRVRLEIDGGAGPDSVVAKFPSQNIQTRAISENYDSYAREIRFYQRHAHRMPVRVAKYMGAGYDPGRSKQPGPIAARIVDALPARLKIWISSNVTKYMRPTKRRYALLIEDLGSAGSVYDIIDPPDLGQLGAALDTLARMHAEFWGDPTLAEDDCLDTLVTPTPGLFRTVAARRCLPAARERFDWLGDAEAEVLAEAIAGFREDVRLLNQPLTLVHGDARSDNMMFCEDGAVALLDWALAGHGHPGWDIGYLLSSSLRVELVEERDQLIEGYAAVLRENGAEMDLRELKAAVSAAYRANAVTQLLASALFDGTLDDGETELSDMWLPRIVAGLLADRG